MAMEANDERVAAERNHVMVAFHMMPESKGVFQLMEVAKDAKDFKHTENKVEGIFFDSRKDTTLVQKKDPITVRFHPRPVKESHTTVTSEPDGAYCHHFTPDKPSPPYKPA